MPGRGIASRAGFILFGHGTPTRIVHAIGRTASITCRRESPSTARGQLQERDSHGARRKKKSQWNTRRRCIPKICARDAGRRFVRSTAATA